MTTIFISLFLVSIVSSAVIQLRPKVQTDEVTTLAPWHSQTDSSAERVRRQYPYGMGNYGMYNGYNGYGGYGGYGYGSPYNYAGYTGYQYPYSNGIFPLQGGYYPGSIVGSGSIWAAGGGLKLEKRKTDLHSSPRSESLKEKSFLGAERQCGPAGTKFGNRVQMLSAAIVEHAALGFAFAVLSLFVLAFAVIAVVLLTISHSCWYKCDAEGDPLMEDYNSLFTDPNLETGEPIDTVVGYTPKHADIV
ncbi:unnamed protein product [Caenorhabditis sp. 36 PRJEB53466]|nr:unnamed protein product [Caenorhabditis sp. 36 PRJEB53466]